MKLPSFKKIFQSILFIIFGGGMTFAATTLVTDNTSPTEPAPIEITKEEKYKKMISTSTVDIEIKKLTSKEERSELKSYTIKDRTKLGKYKYQDQKIKKDKISFGIVNIAEAASPLYEIELLSVDVMEGGVEVLAKAWKDGIQIGFGTDGTVEIERFLVHNPPVLVLDPSGLVTRTIPVDPEFPEGATTTISYSEDPELAIQNVIASTIELIQKGPENIVLGKIGNTTSTFYPDPDPETSSVDGYFLYYASTWDVVHDKTDDVPGDGDALSDNSATGWATFVRRRSTDRTIGRGAFLFDTSSIADADSIDSATFSLYGSTVRDSAAGTDKSMGIVQASLGSDTAVIGTDYDNIGDAVNNPTEGATRITFASLSVVAYNDFSLNATGLTWVNKTGTTQIGTRTAWDMDDTEPSAVDTTGSGLLSFMADQTGTTNDPKLVVEHTAAAAEATTEIQNINWWQ